jgi:hypothetical protein
LSGKHDHPVRCEPDISMAALDAPPRIPRRQGRCIYALTSQRQRALPHVMVGPAPAGDIAGAVLALAALEQEMVS